MSHILCLDKLSAWCSTEKEGKESGCDGVICPRSGGMGQCESAAPDSMARGPHEEHDLHPVLAASQGAASRQGESASPFLSVPGKQTCF